MSSAITVLVVSHKKRLTTLRDKMKKKAFQRTSITGLISEVVYWLIIAGFFLTAILIKAYT